MAVRRSLDFDALDPIPSDNDPGAYAHSPAHAAILDGDHGKLREVLARVPKPPPAGTVRTEEESLAAERRADEASAVIDRRDVPGKESPLALAVRLGDAVAVELLMEAGVDASLQNEGRWAPLQEAVCARQEAIVATIVKHYQVLAWWKYMRRLPAVAATMARMRDFYMELSWNFESSVMPFISRIAPSDTYRVWKRGASLRADMTLAGFDGDRKSVV